MPCRYSPCSYDRRWAHLPGGASPTVRRRELAARLRRLRTEAGLTVTQVSDQLLCSPTKISRIETGQRAATLRDVRDLCTIYGVTDKAAQDHLMSLARESRQPGWWRPYDLNHALDTFIGLEAAATAITDYQLLVPGLLQTAEYADEMIRLFRPDSSIEERKRLVDLRLERQQLLRTDDPPRFWAVLDESALQREVGNPLVMRSQLAHLVAVSELQNVTIQVIPFRAGAHQGMTGGFVLLDFADPNVSSVVYLDAIDQLIVEQADNVARYRDVLDALRAVALSPADSIDFISKRQYQINRQLRHD